MEENKETLVQLDKNEDEKPRKINDGDDEKSKNKEMLSIIDLKSVKQGNEENANDENINRNNNESSNWPFSMKPFSEKKKTPDEVSINMDDGNEERIPTSNEQLLNKVVADQRPRKDSLIRKFYAARQGTFERALEDIRAKLSTAVDGNIQSSWLMTEIDFWNHEKERVIVLTNTLMVIIKYNFVAMRVEDCRRIQLHMIDQIQGGRFKYPSKTMMMSRSYQTGIRISWNKKEILTKWQRFSPFFNNPSFVTFTIHKSALHMDNVPAYMKYEDFKKSLIEAIQRSGAVFEVLVEPLFIEIYIGALAVVHNYSEIGFSKDRGKISF